MLKSAVQRVVVAIFSQQGEVMERYLFDVQRFPIVKKELIWVEFEDRNTDDVTGKGKEKETGNEAEGRQGSSQGVKSIKMVDIEEQLRATIRMLDYHGSNRSPLPEDCTYTLAVELRDDPEVMPPIGVSTIPLLLA